MQSVQKAEKNYKIVNYVETQKRDAWHALNILLLNDNL